MAKKTVAKKINWKARYTELATALLGEAPPLATRADVERQHEYLMTRARSIRR